MKRKNILFLIISLAVVTIFVGCGSPSQNNDNDIPITEDISDSVENGMDLEENEELLLTIDELAEFDGRDGRPAYVAVDGIIYDVTDSRRWSGGVHNGFEAGRDLTEEIKNQSPHGVRTLNNVPAIGRIVD